jgi:hypothetical protein
MKASKVVSLSLLSVTVTLALSGCFGGKDDKTPSPTPNATPMALEFSETKRDIAGEIKKVVPQDDAKTNKAIIGSDSILLVTYAADNCVTPPNSVQITEGNTLLVEIPEAKPLIACKGDIKPHGWDIKVPDNRGDKIKSAQLTFPSGISGGLAVYVSNPEDDSPESTKPTAKDS